MTAPADTIVYDSLTVAYWQGQPEYDYNRELITPEFDLIAWLNLWLGKLLQKIFGSDLGCVVCRCAIIDCLVYL